MSGTHRAGGPGRRWLILLAVLLLGAVAAGGYRLFFHEGPPDVDAAGPGYWVSTRGTDDADGSPEHPWRSIAHAVEVAPAGAKIFVRDGTYDPFTVARPNLTVMSAPKEHATVKGVSGVRDGILVAASGTTIADLTVRGCVPKPNADVDITGDHGSGIRVHKTSDVTVSGVTVRDSHGTNSAGLQVGCYGILVTDSQDVHVTGSEVMRNGAGIVVSGGGQGVVVDGNNVHDQDVIVQNSTAKDDDFGGYGLAATFVQANPGPVFRNNTVRDNHGPSSDYGTDGGGIEIYDAANLTITGNTFEANDGVLETGTGGRGGCANNVFTGNRAIGGNGPTGFDSDTGLVLRCAAGNTVSNNNFSGMQKFTFLLATGSDFAGSIEGLKITGNTVFRNSGTVVYRLQIDSGKPNLTIDDNTYQTGENAFAVLNGTTSETNVPYDQWRSTTKFDAHSTMQ